MKTWKEQEVQSQMVVNKLKQDKEISLSNETNCINVRNFLQHRICKNKNIFYLILESEIS
jgi:hypothetical protein